MALVVEDGSGLADANSYITLAEVRAFAIDRGVTLPSSDDSLIPLLVQACDWTESYADRFVGTKTTETQALAWPRLDSEGVDLGIPAMLKRAQCFAVISAHNGITLQPDVAADVARVTKEKVGDLEVNYSAPKLDELQAGPQLTAAYSALKTLFYSSSLGFTTIRV
ncbi:head tail connector protein yqbg [Caudoviricetes sp.]|nr:head tail connector protein yqbg [Caudoviricetes sp.]